MLRLPDGLEVVGKGWFHNQSIQRLVVPSSVRELGEEAFGGCEGLREVVFEPGSRLERLGESCFEECGLLEIVVPRSVRVVGAYAFLGCLELSVLRFEDGSRIQSLGHGAFFNTKLRRRGVRYPPALKTNGSEYKS